MERRVALGWRVRFYVQLWSGRVRRDFFPEVKGCSWNLGSAGHARLMVSVSPTPLAPSLRLGMRRLETGLNVLFSFTPRVRVAEPRRQLPIGSSCPWGSWRRALEGRGRPFAAAGGSLRGFRREASARAFAFCLLEHATMPNWSHALREPVALASGSLQVHDGLGSLSPWPDQHKQLANKQSEWV